MRVYVCECVCLFFYVSIFIAFTHFVEKTRIQTIENSEKDNSEIKQEIRKKSGSKQR